MWGLIPFGRITIGQCLKEKITEPDIHVNGYTILKNKIQINKKVIKQIYSQINKKRKIIFNSERNDNKRLQCNLYHRQRYMTDFVNNIRSIIFDSVGSKLIINDWVILKSLEGCKEQLPHCDYIPSDEFKKCDGENIPLSFIVSIMDDTKINIWDKSLGYPTDISNKIEKQIFLDEGDIFIFRGDLVHAGSSYDKENTRLHAFLDSVLCPRTKNRTFIIKKHASKHV
uniref:Phytanoyl-CoA dioxygenase n=1 Tax=Marseillevirus LCMAC101 TaxID=2506602 RepID=A0A481YR79_9VIRU|nr:MAG: hypothetical protein LCMAC101_03070 [Marseillevirus LCMAC101]